MGIIEKISTLKKGTANLITSSGWCIYFKRPEDKNKTIKQIIETETFKKIEFLNKDAFLSPEEAALIKMSNETFEQADTNRDSKLNKTEFLKIWENLPR